MAKRSLFGFGFGIVIGFLGLWGLQIETLGASAVFVLLVGVAFGVVFSLVGEKAIDRIVWFFTHYWP